MERSNDFLIEKLKRMNYPAIFILKISICNITHLFKNKERNI